MKATCRLLCQTWAAVIVFLLVAAGAEAGSPACCQCDECPRPPGFCFVTVASPDDCDAACQGEPGCQFSSTFSAGVCASPPLCSDVIAGVVAETPLLSPAAAGLAVGLVALLGAGVHRRFRWRR